ncbi:acylphosphatase-1-like [Daphnia pulex]|uniref:acylphosphatase-1-like n=1 Tax=Daphnia pulex TaxID=6669 RepID=UPI001EDDFD80|nr:acylphosphatase-1-like [Daphnia pulex]
MAEIRSPVSLVSVEFEIFGKVQGVFFRKCTRDQGSKLGLKGWCRNTESGTVEGVLEGTPDQVNMMKEWLRYKGSPQSRIDKAEFRNEKVIESLSFTAFGVKK